VGLGGVGLKAEDLLEGGSGFAGLVLLVQKRTEQVPGFDVAGVGARELPAQPLGLGQIAPAVKVAGTIEPFGGG
jgi:hypothetical protein